jgi:RNA polymerase sigma-70 factor, ECF subfamily
MFFGFPAFRIDTSIPTEARLFERRQAPAPPKAAGRTKRTGGNRFPGHKTFTERGKSMKAAPHQDRDRRFPDPENATLKNLPDQAAAGHLDLGQWKLYDLLQECLHTRDEYLWAEFIRRTQPLITATITHRLRTCPSQIAGGVVDDLVQDTYLKLCENNFRPLREFKYDHENGIYGLLKAAACSVSGDYIRHCLSQKRGGGMATVCLEDGMAVLAPVNVAGHPEREVVLHEIDRLLATCSDDATLQRDCAIFWLYYRYGLTSNAIARIAYMGLTVKGVESTILRLTRRVKERYPAKRPRFERSSAMHARAGQSICMQQPIAASAS